MEKERKITAPEGCEIEKVDLIDGVAVVTFKEKERKLPKSWEEFCEMFPIKDGECLIESYDEIERHSVEHYGRDRRWRNLLPDRATAEAVLALSQLIQLRNCYNGDWVPDWTDEKRKYTIEFYENDISDLICYASSKILFFKSEELRDEFLRYFRPLIEKLKPLYGIK